MTKEKRDSEESVLVENMLNAIRNYSAFLLSAENFNDKKFGYQAVITGALIDLKRVIVEENQENKNYGV